MKRFYICVITLLLLHVNDSGAFLSWIFGKRQENDPSSTDKSAVSVGRVPFEMKTADEKFLGTGKELMAGLSELDVCHHTVIYQLKTSCNEMAEEELAKLGVRLLNCQSAAEGRPTYKCDEYMTVADCTKAMDPNTWNAYHIVSNRARSVCYAVRQQQFQRQTQFAVNQLALSAEGQLHLMENLKTGQEDLSNMASDTLHTISEGQEKLVQSQEMIRNSQSRLKINVESNIRDLSREKALIAAGHQELAAMTTDIRKQLDEATKQLLDQDIDQAGKHQELLEDLSSLSLLAKDVWNKLDHNMQYMQHYQEETQHHYQQTMENLRRMNNTITYLMHVMEDMQTEFSHQLGWVRNLLTWTGENMAIMVTCLLHTCYFFLAAVLCTFLNTPFFSRMVLLLLVPLNAVSEIRQATSLTFPALSFLIVAVVIANWVVLWISAWSKRGRVNTAPFPRLLHIPALPQIRRPSKPDLTYEPSALSSDGDSGLITTRSSRHLSSTRYSSMLTDTSRNLTSILSASALTDSIADSNGSDTDSDIFSSDLDDTAEQSTARMLTVTNLSINTEPNPEPMPEPTPMPSEQSSSGNMMDFGTITSTVAKRHLGLALEQVQAASGPRTPGPSKKGRREGTPSSRSSSPSRRSCTGQTKAGMPCRLPCSAGSDFCYRHGGTPSGSRASTPVKAD